MSQQKEPYTLFFYNYAEEPELNKFLGLTLRHFYDIIKLGTMWWNAGA